MNYSMWGEATSVAHEQFGKELGAALERAGFEPAADPTEADLVINLINPDDPKPFRRRARGTFVAAIHEQRAQPDDVLQLNYPLMVRALANIMMLLRPRPGRLVHDHGARSLRRRGRVTASLRSPIWSSSGSRRSRGRA